MARRRWNRNHTEQINNKKTKQYWNDIIYCHPRMEVYYALQGIHSSRKYGNNFQYCHTFDEKEEERQKWLKSLQSNLPASFRFRRDIDPYLRNMLEDQLSEYMGHEFDVTETQDGKTTTTRMAPVKSITYIPHAYQLSMDRRTIRRSPSLEKFHNWLKEQVGAGFITRQETVSMIPPVVLSPEQHHAVIDLCASPGSKTSQILELTGKISSGTEPKGFVVANDSDMKRAYMLVHQLKRLNSPATIITSADAQYWPTLSQKFDRVLCDVPCSGDGTTRKNPGIWKYWNNNIAMSLHPLQINIAINGVRLMKVGGNLCYSTCSMNPIENEAVVCEILRSSVGALELIDKRKDLPGLFARPGLTTWKVLVEPRRLKQEESTADNNYPKIKSYSWNTETLEQEACDVGFQLYPTLESVPIDSRGRIRSTCFPPTEDEIIKFKLQNCMRILPHDMNTGGFFVALFHKVRSVPECRNEIFNTKHEYKLLEHNNKLKFQVNNPTDTVNMINSKLRGKCPSGKTDLCNKDYLPLQSNILTHISNFYGLSKSLPSYQFMTRTKSYPKILYFVPKSIQHLFNYNILEKVTVLTTGLRAFERGNRDKIIVQCSYRLCQECIHFILPYMSKRKFIVNSCEFKKCLLGCRMIPCDTFNPSLARGIRSLSVGAFAIVLKGFVDNIEKKMILTMWRCRGDAVNCLVTQLEQDGMKSKLEALKLGY